MGHTCSGGRSRAGLIQYPRSRIGLDIPTARLLICKNPSLLESNELLHRTDLSREEATALNMG